MAKKTWVMIGAVLAAVAVVVGGCGKKNEAYRSIMVYQVNGDATITRERVGEMEAYENLMLQSGDSVAVASDSSVRLKLDDDKYLLAEQDTLMNIVADGNGENERTYIDLQKGSVTSEIQNKLKSGASYEVNTPNSIMAVRGTIFRVEVEVDENGVANTKLTVFQGTVSAKAVMPDGTISEEEVMVEAGKELTVEGTPADSEVLDEPKDIDYDSLTPVIKEYLEELEQSSLIPDNNNSNKGNKKADVSGTQGQPESQKAGQPGIEEPELQEAGQQETEQPELQEAEQQGTEEPESQEPETKSQEPESQKPETEWQEPESQEPEAEQPETKSQEPEAEQPETEQPEADTQKTEPQSKAQDSASNQEPESQQSSGGGDKNKTQYYTVTFQYNGSTFGTQRVKKGEKATEPKLCPTENGAWDYDFSEKVNKNLVIQWKEK